MLNVFEEEEQNKQSMSKDKPTPRTATENTIEFQSSMI